MSGKLTIHIELNADGSKVVTVTGDGILSPLVAMPADRVEVECIDHEQLVNIRNLGDTEERYMVVSYPGEHVTGDPVFAEVYPDDIEIKWGPHNGDTGGRL